MDYYFIIFLLFLVLAIAYFMSRLLRSNHPRIPEPVTQSEYEKQYHALIEEIRSLEAALRKRFASKRLQMKLETKRQQVKHLQTLMTPDILKDYPDSYQTAEEMDQMPSRPSRRSFLMEPFLCPNCKITTQPGDRFCANCGHRIYENNQS
jgi:Na+-transporting methylmalonyl-CoA/oxaloacetate decarboxylase gamma subunit